MVRTREFVGPEVEEVKRAESEVRLPAVREAAPSVRVPADNSPLMETETALVSDPELNDATPSVIVEELKSLSGERVPPFIEETPSETAPAVSSPLMDIVLTPVKEPPPNEAVPSVME